MNVSRLYRDLQPNSYSLINLAAGAYWQASQIAFVLACSKSGVVASLLGTGGPPICESRLLAGFADLGFRAGFLLLADDTAEFLLCADGGFFDVGGS